jgi:hypothetical protein
MTTADVTATGSATTWTRLEPQLRSPDLREGSAARVEDAAWMLARQWQFGEFHGSDGGSPAVARLRLQAGVFSGYRGRGAGGDRDGTSAYDSDRLPLEVLVEREPANPVDLTLRADGGRRFLRLLDQHGAGAYRSGYTAAYPLPAHVTGAPVHAESAALVSVLAGRVPDGQALAAAFGGGESGPPTLPPQPAVPEADRPKVLAAATAYIDWWQSLADRPSPGPPAWDPNRMEHAFALGARLGQANTPVTLVGREYPGGSLDWHDLEIATDGTAVPAAVPGFDLVRTLLPTPVSYPGMPAGRFWEFENARVYLGGTEAGAADLGRMLLSEFAILYSDDWFVVPIDLPVGAVAEVASLVVTDTFGVRTLVGPAAQADWDLFRIGGGGGGGPSGRALFVLPPALPHSQEGEPVEEVLFLRDEMANLAWAVERLVEGVAGRPVDRHEQFLAQVRAGAAAPPPPSGPLPPPDADLEYRLRAGQPPEHWIPLLPEADPTGLRLRRSALPRPGGQEPIEPIGTLLPAIPWVAAEEVPADGVRVVRHWQLARWGDGSSHLWMSRRKQAGRGEASSGLRYDVVERVDDTSQ